MRLVRLFALALLSPLASAQAQYADSTGGYLALHEFSFGGGKAIDATVGRRLGDGLDAGLRLGYASYGSGRVVSGGPVVGLSRSLGRGWSGRVEGALRYESSDLALRSATFETERFAARTLSEDVTTTVARSVRLVGSVRLRPTLGLYASSTQRLTLDVPERYRRGPDMRASAGLHLELPLTFRLFGQDAALAVAGRYPLAGDPYNGMTSVQPAYAGGGLRLNF